MEIRIPELDRITELLEDIKGLLQHMTVPAVQVADPEVLAPVSEVAEPVIPTAAPVQTERPPLPTAAPTCVFTLRSLVDACRPLIDSGKREDIKNIITEMGFTQLSDVPAERYEEFAAKIREIGAAI